MDIEGSVALVTGANRGLGRHFVTQLLDRGAARVYASARTPSPIDSAIPLALDITDEESIAAAVLAAPDVTLLINNAGISTGTRLIDGDMSRIRQEMETHFFGTLGVIRAFAPVLRRNGGGAILNILSTLSWAHYPNYGAYSAGKAAAWAMTNVVRQELAPSGIDVSSLHVGYIDTEMSDHVDDASRKSDPASIAAISLDGIQARIPEILADTVSRNVKAALSADIRLLYADVFRDSEDNPRS